MTPGPGGGGGGCVGPWPAPAGPPTNPHQKIFPPARNEIYQRGPTTDHPGPKNTISCQKIAFFGRRKMLFFLCAGGSETPNNWFQYPAEHVPLRPAPSK